MREHFIRNFCDVADLFGLPTDIQPLPYPPEPLTLALLKADGVTAKRFVYPDPPLRDCELRWLKALDDKITLTTPLLLLATWARSADRADSSTTDSAWCPSPRRTPGLTADRADPSTTDSAGPTRGWRGRPSGCRSGTPGPERERAGRVASQRCHRVVRPVPAGMRGEPGVRRHPASGKRTGWRIAAGLPRAAAGDGARVQEAGDPCGVGVRLTNYFAEVNRNQFDARFRAKWRCILDLQYVAAPPGVPEPADEAEQDYFTARCLTAMREEMTRHVDARVLLGGKTFGFQGKYPGLVEEAYLAMAAPLPRPVYLVGAFGGAARAVIDALRRKPADPRSRS